MRGLIILAAVAIPVAASAQSVQPGLWVFSSSITSMAGPRIPPAMVAALTNQAPTTDKVCLRPAEAWQGFLNMLKKKSSNCTIKSSSFAGGAADIQAVCNQSGRLMTMHFHGPFSASDFTLKEEGADRNVKTSMIFSARRIGSCG